MKINLLLLTILTAAVSSCSTAYKTGQTPDDVYYSPVRLQTDDVRRERQENNTDNSTVYTSHDDLEIRRRVHNRRYRRYNNRYNNPYGYTGPVYGNPKYGSQQQNTSQPRKTNLGAYSNNTSSDSAQLTNPKLSKINDGKTSSPVRTFSNPGGSNGTAVGNAIRRVFNGSGNSGNTNYNTDNSNNSSSSRTFDRSSNNSSSNNSGSSNTKKLFI